MVHPLPIPEIYPLRTIHETHLSEVCSLRQLEEWAHRVPHFPEPKRRMGQFKLFDPEEVVVWVTLWKRINGHRGNPNLNKKEPT